MPNLRWQELLIIVALVLLLFGAKRLPDAARGLGRSMRIFKAETKGLVDDEKAGEADAAAEAPAPSELESGSTGTTTNQESAETADRPRADG